MIKRQEYINKLNNGLMKGEGIMYISEEAAREIVELLAGDESDMIPCDVCAYGPPSSMDGKPCSYCPAVAKGADE